MSELDRLLDALLRADRMDNQLNRRFCVDVARENIRLYVERYARGCELPRAA